MLIMLILITKNCYLWFKRMLTQLEQRSHTPEDVGREFVLPVDEQPGDDAPFQQEKCWRFEELLDLDGVFVRKTLHADFIGLNLLAVKIMLVMIIVIWWNVDGCV